MISIVGGGWNYIDKNSAEDPTRYILTKTRCNKYMGLYERI